MTTSEQDTCESLGWALIDLDDPNPKRAYKAAQRLGIHVEELIDEAIKEGAVLDNYLNKVEV